MGSGASLSSPYASSEGFSSASPAQQDGPGRGLPIYSVWFACTQLGGIGFVRPYHTSVLVGGLELSFCSLGICTGEDTASHPRGLNATHKLALGYTDVSPEDLILLLLPFFRAGTYDVLKKNCNSFTDCALAVMLQIRLDAKYRSMENIGSYADRKTSLLQNFTSYTPNPKADDFDLESVIGTILSKRTVTL